MLKSKFNTSPLSMSLFQLFHDVTSANFRSVNSTLQKNVHIASKMGESWYILMHTSDTGCRDWINSVYDPHEIDHVSFSTNIVDGGSIFF